MDVRNKNLEKHIQSHMDYQQNPTSIFNLKKKSLGVYIIQSYNGAYYISFIDQIFNFFTKSLSTSIYTFLPPKRMASYHQFEES